MTHFDVFNGDADGLIARHQLRLAEPLAAVTLITGVKRDNGLLARVPVSSQAVVNVFDLSYDQNADAAAALLNAGAKITYFDHHRAHKLIAHARLAAHIDTAPDQCTSLIVDRLLKRRFHAWAIAAAFGDGLAVAAALATAAGFAPAATASLRELGTLLNYNAYGETEDDLYFRPADLALQLLPFADPFAFIEATDILARLRAGYESDLAEAKRVQPAYAEEALAIFRLPPCTWARRVSGAFAHHLAEAHPARAHAILTPNRAGTLTVSIRAPRVYAARAAHAGDIAAAFGGGGRAGAAGIDALAERDVTRLVEHLSAVYRSPSQSA